MRAPQLPKLPRSNQQSGGQQYQEIYIPVPKKVNELILLILVLCLSVLTVANISLITGWWDIDGDSTDGALKATVIILGILGIVMVALVYKDHNVKE